LILSTSSSSSSGNKYNDNSIKEKKQLMGLLCSVSRNEMLLRELISTTAILNKEKEKDGGGVNYFLLMILVHELLISKGGLRLRQSSGSNRKSCKKEWELVQKYKQELKEAYNKQIKDTTTNNNTASSSTSDHQFKYVRVNHCKSSMEEVLEYFLDEQKGYTLIDSLEDTQNPMKKNKLLWIMKDKLFSEDLLLFPKNTEFYNDLFYKEGKIVLQDKASCMPAHCVPYSLLLFKEEGEEEQQQVDFIDACAAPGNKTSHLCSLIISSSSSKKRNSGNNDLNSKVFAFDRDEQRCKLLKEMMQKHVSTDSIAVECMQMDFLQVDYNDEKYRNVKVILCDPSCSGSGIVSRGNCRSSSSISKGRDVNPQRLQSLHAFQVKILEHAFKFPSCEYVVYSTCSVYEEENESVVGEILGKQHHQKEWDIVKVLDGWNRRGIGMEECVRCLPEEDGTHGFFVCMFRRKILE
jgi:putative methyltransferase